MLFVRVKFEGKGSVNRLEKAGSAIPVTVKEMLFSG
jgi:hypothetical protein